MKITLGDVRGLARLLHTRKRMTEENYFPVEDFHGGDYAAYSAPDHRTLDGSANDPRRPELGQIGKAFMRNVPLDEAGEDARLYEPDPRVIGRRLLANDAPEQVLATRVNYLCAAWIQFQVHDWFDHETNPEQSLALDGSGDFDALRLERTRALGQAPDSDSAIYANAEGHWWDSSQLYGNTAAVNERLRRRGKGGKLLAELDLPDAGPDKGEPMLPLGAPLPEHGSKENEIELTGFVKNWWVGLSALHVLFAREHNAIVAELRKTSECKAVPSAEREQWLFRKAQLVNTALIAKIHTVEWTTAMIETPSIVIGLLADWWGIGPEAADDLIERIGRVTHSDPDSKEITNKTVNDLYTGGVITAEEQKVFLGIIDNDPPEPPARVSPSPREHAPDGSDLVYAMSEEFVAVYRMHALMRDPMPLVRTTGERSELPLREVTFSRTRGVMERYGCADVLYSLGTEASAALRLNNYPAGLSSIDLPGDDRPLDLGAVDILRDRERGIPRYAAFKRIISKQAGPLLTDAPTPPVTRFSDICGDPNEPGISSDERDRRVRDARLLAKTYASPEDVDLLVGMMAEPLPAGFSFSWTAFEIFLLMTILRLTVDRFFTADYTAEVYTSAGMKWINDHSMADVILRHYPALKGKVPTDKNPFTLGTWT